MAEWFQKTTLGTLVDDAAKQFGPREALCFQGQRWSFSQFQEDVDQAARGLIHLGIQPGEKVSLWMPNRPEWLHILYGAAKIGAVVVPINTRFRTPDLEYVVRQSDSSTLITVDRSGPVEYLEMVRQVYPEIQYCDTNNLHSENFPQLKRVLILGDSPYPGTHCWADVITAVDAVPMRELEQRQQRVNPDDTALIMYTSGTTGFPSGADTATPLLVRVP
jgi:fatty-acyl-CoA synthase